MWLEQPGNEIYAKAHKTWEAQDALFASRIDKKKQQSNLLRNKIYQLFGFYSVFQGVLLTAVTSLTSLVVQGCHLDVLKEYHVYRTSIRTHPHVPVSGRMSKHADCRRTAMAVD